MTDERKLELFPKLLSRFAELACSTVGLNAYKELEDLGMTNEEIDVWFGMYEEDTENGMEPPYEIVYSPRHGYAMLLNDDYGILLDMIVKLHAGDYCGVEADDEETPFTILCNILMNRFSCIDEIDDHLIEFNDEIQLFEDVYTEYSENDKFPVPEILRKTANKIIDAINEFAEKCEFPC